MSEPVFQSSRRTMLIGGLAAIGSILAVPIAFIRVVRWSIPPGGKGFYAGEGWNNGPNSKGGISDVSRPRSKSSGHSYRGWKEW